MAQKDSIEAFSEAHEIGKEFYSLQLLLDDLSSDDNWGMKTLTTEWTNLNGDTETRVDAFAQTFKGNDDEYYVRFQYFLWFLESRIIPNIDYDPNIKLVKIDWSDEGNIIYTVPGTFSSNPKVCMTRRGPYYIVDIPYYFVHQAEKFEVSIPGAEKKDVIYGNIMNIYFNMFWILQQIDSLKDAETGKISLYGLLDALCQGYNQATGNFNRLEPIVDTETNTIKIVDDVALPDRDVILEYYGLVPSYRTATFDTYGYYSSLPGSVYGEGVSHASFIRDLKFNTSVTPNLATMITVGATNQGYVKGEDATALSRMNRGLTDRFKKEITDTDQNPNSPTTFPDLANYYLKAYIAYYNYVTNIALVDRKEIPNYDEKAISDFQSLQVQWLEYFQAQQTWAAAQLNNKSASPNSGFLPFDLSLTMDGLSGMKVYQTFNIDSEFLPTNYPGTLLFLIKGINDKIENNQWTTTIDSMCVTKNPFGATNKENPVDEASRTSNRGNPVVTSRVGSGVYTPSNLNAVKGNASLRQVLINAGYREGTGKYQFAYSIGTKEGWNSRANGGIGTRSYRNNNPGNLNYDNSLKSIDPGVTLENNPFGASRFAHFTTAELGAKALVETKIQKWADGNMPTTKGNQTSIVQQRGGNKYQRGSKPTIAQFFYTYAPPTDGNNTEKYINDVIRDLKATKPSINRNTLVKNAIA